ncbi:MAG: hypothetical protein E4H40_01735 [Candidatus Brocadiia bacterium]|nr:MAG: hypothetical protein E4H40_01735 [Candidatus Brocadiia bacterium]
MAATTICVSTLSAAEYTGTEGPSVVKIVKTAERFELRVNGQPFFINGAGGVRNLDALVKAGGNSVRTWRSSKTDLNKAHEKGLMVCMGLSLASPRHGADYNDTEMLNRLREKIRKEVMALKDHPALLIWGIGNEVEHHTNKEDRILVWKEINGIAEMIKRMDKNHPVITVIAGLDNESSESVKIRKYV